MWRRSKVSSLRFVLRQVVAWSTRVCNRLARVVGCVHACARRRASTAPPPRSLYRKGCDLRVLVSAARESAAFFFASRRVEALQLIMDTASHGSSALTGVSLFG